MFDQKTKTIRDYRRLIKKIVTDESFERPYGCWGARNRNGFIQDVFCEFAATPIVLADVGTCRSFAEDYEDDKITESYFAKLESRGKRYVSLDGKHRTECIRKFLDNKIAFTGTTVDDDGNKVAVRNKFFKDLKPKVQNRFLNSRISLTIFEDIKQKDLSRIFLSLNANESLTKQHKRNAEQTPFAPWTRETVEEFKNLFLSMYGQSQYAQMKPHEMLSKMYCHIANNKSDVGDKSLDALYRKGVGLQWRELYSSKVTNKIKLILDLLNTVNSSTPLQKGRHLCFFLVVEKIIDNNYVVLDEKKFCEKVVELDIDLERQSRLEEANVSNSGTATKVSDYYFEQVRLNWSRTYRSARQKTIWGEICKDLESYGISQDVLQAA